MNDDGDRSLAVLPGSLLIAAVVADAGGCPPAFLDLCEAPPPLFLIWLFEEILNICMPSFRLSWFRDPLEFLEIFDCSLR